MIGLEFIVKTFEMKFKDVAEVLGVSPKTVNDWVKRRSKIPKKRVKELGEYFNLNEELFQKELSKAEQLKIQIIYIERNNEEFEIDEEFTDEQGKTHSYKSKHRTHDAEISFLNDQLEIVEQSEGIYERLKSVYEDIQFTRYEEYTNQTLTDITRLFDRILNIIEHQNSEKPSFLADIAYFLDEFYDVPEEKWLEVNPLIETSDMEVFFKDLNDLLKKHSGI